MSYTIDYIDLQLLKLLKENARMSYAKLANELNISESAVRKRIAKLVKSGIIKKFTIEYELINEIRAAILVKTQPPTPVPEISKKIIKINGVEVVYEVTGDYDILAIVKATGIDIINRCIDEIRSIPGVAGTNTLIVLRSWR
ncbi:MAG: AsnC family transcriptional regulator [Thermoprotei archaeon]|nr:MAG: AsnC family transcriptional regulator [Thermoprotei archaeon]